MQRPYTRRYLPPSVKQEAFFGDFEYIVNKPEKEPLCFGSKMERVTLPNDPKYQNTFMRRKMVKVKPNLGPATYNNERGAFYDLDHKPCSTLGLGSKEPRWLEKHEYQPPLQKLPQLVKPKQNYAPFNQISRRKTLMKTSDYPAPCDYWPGVKKQELKFNYCFNSKRELRCAVPIKCVSYNLDECAVCGCSCSAQGDYWQFEDRLFLCRKHYSQRFKNCKSKYRGVKLSNFEPVRDCFFMHSHNSCKASLKIMRREDIIKKLRKEAYLDLYFPQRRACM